MYSIIINSFYLIKKNKINLNIIFHYFFQIIIIFYNQIKHNSQIYLNLLRLFSTTRSCFIFF